jgi:glycosyltransferase involved in cell wall biosynthesis
MNIKVCCCLCVRNCEKYLPKIFENLDLLSKEFSNFYVVFVFDNCYDQSELLLREYKEKSKIDVFIIHNENNNSPYIAVRIEYGFVDSVIINICKMIYNKN